MDTILFFHTSQREAWRRELAGAYRFARFRGWRVQVVEPREGGKPRNVACDGLFVAIGLIPENEAFRNVAALDRWGYFDSPESCETDTHGIFAAGDCRAKQIRQLTTAVGDGSIAALAACRYIDAMG